MCLRDRAYVAGNVLAFIHNALTYSSESGAQLRRHLSVDTSLIPEVRTSVCDCVAPWSLQPHILCALYPAGLCDCACVCVCHGTRLFSPTLIWPWICGKLRIGKLVLQASLALVAMTHTAPPLRKTPVKMTTVRTTIQVAEVAVTQVAPVPRGARRWLPRKGPRPVPRAPPLPHQTRSPPSCLTSHVRR